MNQNWDFYPARVDDLPASIYLNLGAARAAPMAGLPHMAYVRLEMNTPREDGLSSQDEFDTLNAIEDHLEKALGAEHTAKHTVYVGRCTSAGCRDFYFYVAETGNWQARVASAMAAFPAYGFATGSRADAQWQTYFGFLYPSDADMEGIQNRRVCRQLEAHGDPLTAARDIAHFASFPSIAARDAFVSVAAGLGYVTHRLINRPGDGADQPADPARPHCAYLVRSDVPGYGNIDAITGPLHRLAAEHGGRYDGWEAPVLKD